MPARKPKTKTAKREAVADVMDEYKRGTLRSGSKTGPRVTKRKQAQAIALSEAGLSKKRRKRASA